MHIQGNRLIARSGPFGLIGQVGSPRKERDETDDCKAGQSSYHRESDPFLILRFVPFIGLSIREAYPLISLLLKVLLVSVTETKNREKVFVVCKFTLSKTVTLPMEKRQDVKNVM